MTPAPPSSMTGSEHVVVARVEGEQGLGDRAALARVRVRLLQRRHAGDRPSSAIRSGGRLSADRDGML